MSDCEYDHDTRDNATCSRRGIASALIEATLRLASKYGGDPGHDFYHCDGCGERISIVV